MGQGEVGGVTRRMTCTWVAARLGCERIMVGTGWATSHPDYMDSLTKHYSHLVEGYPGSEWVYDNR